MKKHPSLPMRFQFTPLREGRRIGQNAGKRRGTYFNSRPSARGDRRSISCSKSLTVFQFTPLREGRLGGANLEIPSYSISIHAPPRGATT